MLLQYWRVKKIVYKYDLVLIGMDLYCVIDQLWLRASLWSLFRYKWQFELDVSSSSSVLSSYDVQNASLDQCASFRKTAMNLSFPTVP